VPCTREAIQQFNVELPDELVGWRWVGLTGRNVYEMAAVFKRRVWFWEN
jgi:hypothetical protein